MFKIQYIFSKQNYVFPAEYELTTNFFLHHKGEFFRSVLTDIYSTKNTEIGTSKCVT